MSVEERLVGGWVSLSRRMVGVWVSFTVRRFIAAHYHWNRDKGCETTAGHCKDIHIGLEVFVDKERKKKPPTTFISWAVSTNPTPLSTIPQEVIRLNFKKLVE